MISVNGRGGKVEFYKCNVVLCKWTCPVRSCQPVKRAASYRASRIFPLTISFSGGELQDSCVEFFKVKLSTWLIRTCIRRICTMPTTSLLSKETLCYQVFGYHLLFVIKLALETLHSIRLPYCRAFSRRLNLALNFLRFFFNQVTYFFVTFFFVSLKFG